MTIINLPEGTHTIKWILSGYNDLTAQIRISSTGAVTCISVSSGSCGGSSVPRVSISGSTVTGYMKSGSSTPTPTPSPTSTPTPIPGKVYVEKLVNEASKIVPPFKLQYDKDELTDYLYAPDGTPHSSDAYADYDIYIPTAGTYKMVGRVLASDYSSNSFFIQFDDVQYDIWDIKISGNYRWRNVSFRGFGTELDPEYPLHTIYLTRGNHKIKVMHRENKTRLYKFVLTNDMDYLDKPSSSHTPTPTQTPTQTPSPTPSTSFNSWLASKGGDIGLLNNLSALLEIIDGYLGFTNLGFTVSLANLLYVVDGYLGF